MTIHTQSIVFEVLFIVKHFILTNHKFHLILFLNKYIVVVLIFSLEPFPLHITLLLVIELNKDTTFFQSVIFHLFVQISNLSNFIKAQPTKWISVPHFLYFLLSFPNTLQKAKQNKIENWFRMENICSL